MPLLRVTLTPGAFDAAQKADLAAALTDIACRAEGVPDGPGQRMRALVLLEELAPGNFFSAGACADDAVAGVFVDWQSQHRRARRCPQGAVRGRPSPGGARGDRRL